MSTAWFAALGTIMRPMTTASRITAAIGALALVLAACSSDAADTESSEAVDQVESTVDVPPTTDATEPTPAEPSATASPSTEPPSTETAGEPSSTWARIVPDSEDCACSDGSEFALFERPADPTKVMFYFEGGGACFSAETCDPINGTYSPTITQTVDNLVERRGLFDATNEINPLADYSVVYVPYCTGDVHLGNATTEYSDTLTIEHRGYANGTAALAHLAAAYPDVEELLVTGASAGSVPTPLMAGLASDVLPGANIITFGDSSGAYPDVPAVNGVIGNLWGTTNAIPDWPENDGLTAADWSFPGLYVQAGLHDPDITFGRFDYAFDDAQATFGALAGVPADELVTLIDETEAQVEASGSPIASYVAPGSGHTIMGSDAVYELEVEGVKLIDWITTLVGGEVPDDVRCVECTGS
jgi:hypothetical protein